jgi:hypothetical protein
MSKVEEVSMVFHKIISPKLEAASAASILAVSIIVPLFLMKPAHVSAAPSNIAGSVVAADGDNRANDIRATWTTGGDASYQARLRRPDGTFITSPTLSSTTTSYDFKDRRQSNYAVQVRAGTGTWLPATPVPVFLSDQEFHGTNMNILFTLKDDDNDNGSITNIEDPTEWEPWLDLAQAQGIKIARSDAFWSDSEPAAPVNGVHNWRWSRPNLSNGQVDGRSDDAKIRALASNGIRWYPILDYGTPWASANPSDPNAWKQPPVNPANYAAYAQAFAARYGRNGSFWTENPTLPYLPVLEYEIWNEPNLENFWPDQSTAPAKYADLFVQAANAIKTAQPDAKVVIGGLSGSPTALPGLSAWLQSAQTQQPTLFDKSDAVGFHPYGNPVSVTYDRINTLRSILQARGYPSEYIDITETGWAVPPVSSTDRGTWLFDLAANLPESNCLVTKFFVYTWLSNEVNQTNDQDWFGITNRTLNTSGAATMRGSGTQYINGMNAGRLDRTDSTQCSA